MEFVVEVLMYAKTIGLLGVCGMFTLSVGFKVTGEPSHALLTEF